MTEQKRLPSWMTSRASKRPYLVRLNLLLKWAYADLRPLTNGAWENLLDELHFAIFNEKRTDNAASKWFNSIAERTAVWDALDTLKHRMNVDNDVSTPEQPVLRLPLKEAELEIRYTEDSLGGGFSFKILSQDLATLLYWEWANMLNISLVSRDDFRKCDNCEQPFFPLRKPRAGDPTYCSNRCARIVAARNYRASKKKAATKKKKKR